MSNCASVWPILVASISGCVATGAKDLMLRRRIGTNQPGTEVRETVYYWGDTQRVADDPRFRAIFDLPSLDGFPVRTAMEFTVAGRPQSVLTEVVEVKQMSLPAQPLPR